MRWQIICKIFFFSLFLPKMRNFFNVVVADSLRLNLRHAAAHSLKILLDILSKKEAAKKINLMMILIYVRHQQLLNELK